MMKVCSFCGHTTFSEKKVQYIYRHDGNMMVVNNVPCQECDYCGEQYFQAEVLKKIETDFEDIRTERKKPQRQISVPVEEY
ncbi:MAG: type II toxin-antitoxin system MqsA family antitoxin [Candidatus Marinimicrobia bacterium]|nr:type II toxin-antitoxin system MqsA family antitoxin [Candidatus Neomarinimicrobiota bacterium]MCF7828729.1 type II toxin-antitoxin system MqsA family antitoxin [Candidatus Neomarinimicrobiota bacterium]MCF7880646.1 type II toxin-antitoxin system MqsA family antitoxin [Candidatus Neomarinimicrobiota bacterium]